MLTKTIDGDTIRYQNGDQPVLSLEETEGEEGVLLTICGELRSEMAHDFQDELIAFATSSAEVTLDMAGVTYLANSIQDALVSAQQCVDRMGAGSLRLKNLRSEILQDFQSTGIIDCLEILF